MVSANLRLHVHLLHEVTASQQVEQLVGAAHFNVRLRRMTESYACMSGIQELVHGDRLFVD